MKTLGILFLSFIIVCVVIVGGYALGWFGEAASVVSEEFGPRNSLVKYEWFKDASFAIEAKASSIQVFEASIRDLEQQYADTPRKEWPRDDREALTQKQVELNGLKAAYNNLVGEYNAASSKFNWAYYNVDNIPQTYQEK